MTESPIWPLPAKLFCVERANRMNESSDSFSPTLTIVTYARYILPQCQCVFLPPICCEVTFSRFAHTPIKIKPPPHDRKKVLDNSK